MIGARRRLGGDSGDNVWPGFVDALSTLLLVIIFLLSLFVLAQFFLGQALSGRDKALAELRMQVLELGDLLKMEQQASAALRDSMAELSSSLEAANKDRDALSAELESTKSALASSTARLAELDAAASALGVEAADLKSRYATASEELEREKALSESARRQVETLQRSITALREQLARLEAALQASEERDQRNQAVIVDLGRRLNRALAAKVDELAGYRSEFFGRLKEVLANRPEVRIEGDRFVFASELLFESGSAELGPEGRAEMRKFAETLLTISRELPSDLDWVLRVDGHTDKRPISTARFRNNWELSTARAVSVVEFLVEQGVEPHRLAAAGFGEHHPLDPADNTFAYARNRRIEMRLDQR
ncbi:peptidoglycan -binding protein [Pseudokordiimonas caeni]|uniref:peptidoglycan -binding protein n=1 Tax=Pseudokordiimonas caeni TaxID=2997908 RepID=UPI0028126D36|nr:peptidoglycan -binding protein [Pseudokordiimonas caeni]